MTDTSRIVANALETVPTGRLVEFVKKYLERENVGMVVVGFPRNLNGEDSDSMKHLAPVARRLEALIAPVPLVFFDERFTSVLAHRAMIDGGLGRMARRDKALVDKVSAAIILNDFLSSRQYAEMTKAEQQPDKQ